MFPRPSMIDTNGIQMAVYEQGEGPAVVLLHGFPELAFSWRHQLPALAAAGFRAIAPDQRGYGRTGRPEGVTAYRLAELIADIEGLLDALELESAIFVGHDLGAKLLWHMAMLNPRRIDALIQLNIPHMPRSPTDPVQIMRQRFGNEYYFVNFQDSDEADRAFAEDTVRFFNSIMRCNQVSREQFEQLPDDKKVLSLLAALKRTEHSGKRLLSDAECDYYANAFAESGFTGPINWYRNWTDNWRSLEGVDQRIGIPTLFIGAEDDIIIASEAIENMKPLVEDLEIHMLKNCGHWSQQQRPGEVNRLMIEWLRKRKFQTPVVTTDIEA